MAFRISLMRLSNDFETIRYDHAKQLQRVQKKLLTHMGGVEIKLHLNVRFQRRHPVFHKSSMMGQITSWSLLYALGGHVSWGVLCSEGCSGSQTLAHTCCWISPGLPFVPSSVHKEIQETRDVCRAHEAD